MRVRRGRFCGKETYEAGDLSLEIDARIKTRVNEFTGKGSYEFGDISAEIEKRRVAWVTDYLGNSECTHGGSRASERCVPLRLTCIACRCLADEFGDLTKKLVRDITGKENCARASWIQRRRSAASTKSETTPEIGSPCAHR
jgi:hypothetical protein